jgi:hypothetical protein
MAAFWIVALTMEAASTAEAATDFIRPHGATAQRAAIFILAVV